MQIAIDAWDPSYGTAGGDLDSLIDSDVPTNVDLEVPLPDWAPRDAAAGTVPWESVVFVDGVQRIDAHAWVTAGDGSAHQGRCVSVAAGAVRCNGLAELLDMRVDRALVAPADGADHLVTKHGTWRLEAIANDDPKLFDRAIGKVRGSAEALIARAVATSSDQLVVDGPLSQHSHLAGAIGYVKSIHARYGPPDVLRVAGLLGAGQRTPLLLVGEGVARWSWYLRLPGAVAHPLAGVVRCEAAGGLTLNEAVLLADRSLRSLPRFASKPHRDARAPQNLVPIAGLERALRRRLGDQQLLLRALRSAAMAGG